MKNNRFLQFIKRPPVWFLAVVYVLAAGFITGSILLITFTEQGGALAYVAYVFFALAAISLAYTVYTVVVFAPVLKEKIKGGLLRRPFTAKLLEHYAFKTAVFAGVSLVISLGFAVMNLVSAILYRSLWYGALAAYYTVLIFFRGGVLFFDVRGQRCCEGDERSYELCKWKIHLGSGAFLVLVEIAMALAVTQMMLSSRPTQSGIIMAISNAAYTFYKMTMAILNLVRARKHDNPVTQSLRNINFADACMSMASLTVLMVATFDEGEPPEMLYVKSIVGFAACAVIVVLASIMIIKANKRIRQLERQREDEYEQP